MVARVIIIRYSVRVVLWAAIKRYRQTPTDSEEQQNKQKNETETPTEKNN